MLRQKMLRWRNYSHSPSPLPLNVFPQLFSATVKFVAEETRSVQCGFFRSKGIRFKREKNSRLKVKKNFDFYSRISLTRLTLLLAFKHPLSVFVSIFYLSSCPPNQRPLLLCNCIFSKLSYSTIRVRPRGRGGRRLNIKNTVSMNFSNVFISNSVESTQYVVDLWQSRHLL